MARPSKIEVSAINIRIPSDHDRDYVALINFLSNLKVGVRVWSDNFVAISYFNPETQVGVFSKYTEIDVDGEWFDVENFDIASAEDVSKVVIPDNLRPNHSAFYFHLSPSDHVVSFQTYSESKTLSAKSVEKFFHEALQRSDVRAQFGFVEADVIQSYEAVDEILGLPLLKDLTITIRRPNSDDVSKDLAKEIEERLREQKGEEYVEGLRSKDADGLQPNERTRKLAQVAAENGKVSARNIENGLMVSHDTSEKPLKEVDTFNREDVNELTKFRQLVDAIIDKVQDHRRRLVSGD